MESELSMLYIFFGCALSKTDDNPTVRIDTATEFEPSWEPSDEPNNDSGNIEESQNLVEGDWSLGSPDLISDACGVAEYQDVSGFIPTSIGIANSTEDGFLMLPDELPCYRNDSDIRCDTFYFDEETSAIGLSATLTIKNEINGTIQDERNMTLVFDVTIQSCDGPGCFFIESALPFPCLLQERTEATALD